MKAWTQSLKLALLALVALVAGCSGGGEPAESVGSITEATTLSCSSKAFAGECRYTPVQATASSAPNSSATAAKAIDGDCSTRWTSAASDPQWLRVDLGSSRALSRVVIHWDSAASKDYQLQTSDDGSAWTTVAQDENAVVTGSGSSRVDTLSGLSAKARYVRVNSLARTGSSGNSILDLEVFGTDCGGTPGCSLIPVFPVSAAASSSENTAKTPDKAIDGLSSTRWSSAFSDPQWIRLDLGTSQTISRVVLDWENSASAKYEVQVSESTSGPWTVAASRSNAQQGPRTDDITGLTAAGRYLRIYSTKRTTQYGVSLYEIKLYSKTCKECEQALVPGGVTSSSTESDAFSAVNAVDGDLGTRWSSTFSDPQWLRIDFGQTRKLRGLILKWETSASKSYRVETSAAASGPWTVLAEKTNQPAGPRIDRLSDLKGTGRYLRIYSTARTSTYGISLYEVITLGALNPNAFCDCPLGDTDKDGASDCIDACPADPLKTLPGPCGCNQVEVDGDNDGIVDCLDGCKNDPTNATCLNDDAVPGPVDLPTPPTVTAVDQTRCNNPSAFGLPEPFRTSNPPTSAEQAKLNSVVPATFCAPFAEPVVCAETQAVTQCPLDPAHVSNTPCSENSPVGDAECGGGRICAFGKPTDCNTPGLLPEEQCKTKQLRCGLPDPECATEPPAPTPGPGDCTQGGNCACPAQGNTSGGCEQVDLCSGPEVTGNRGPTDPSVYDLARPPAPDTSAIQQPTPKLTYTDAVDDPTCDAPYNADCWCNLELGVLHRDSFTKAPIPVHQKVTKSAEHGSGSLLKVNFDPNLIFDVNVNSQPFGETRFNALAQASLVSKLTTNLPLIGERTANLIDFHAGVSAERCDISTLGTSFKIFDIDFVDLSGVGSAPFSAAKSSNSVLAQASATCTKAVDAYAEGADRAKKALKDAQSLIEKYKALAAGKTFKKSDFCAAVLSQEVGVSEATCLNQPIAKTLNQYVGFYNGVKIPALQEAMNKLSEATASLVSALKSVEQDSTYTFLDVHRHESQTILSAQFFVGPVPVNISVDVGLKYGIDGQLFYRFTPFSALAMPPGSPAAQIAGVGGKLVPAVGATLEIFAGVGFDIPGFAIKAGIAGNITLAQLSANLEAGVGLSVQTFEDKRPIPAPLDTLGGDHIFPPREYKFFFDYFYGASLNLDNVLAGTINAKVKLKAFFFSKTFQKTIVTFNSPFSPIHARLFEGGGQLAGITLPASANPLNALGTFQQQIPLVLLNLLPDTGPDPTTPDSQESFDATTLPSPLHYDAVCKQTPPA